MDKIIDLRINTFQAFNNVSIVECGLQSSETAHMQGPVNKTEFVLQYVLAGEGHYKLQGEEFTISPGDLFYLPKNITLSYWPDERNPYTYWWLGFDGSQIDLLLEHIGLTPSSPVLHCRNEAVQSLFSTIFSQLQENSITSLVRAHGTLFELLAILLSADPANNKSIRTSKSQYSTLAILYIQHNYATDMTVTQLANHLSLNRTYFSTLFKEDTGVSPMEYLLNYRINRAVDLLLNSDCNITDISQQCGFKSSSNFCVQFKNIIGYSPSQYRAAKRTAIQHTSVSVKPKSI